MADEGGSAVPDGNADRASEGRRPTGPGTYSAVGAVVFMLGVAVVGLASVAIQLDGWGWYVAFAVLLALAAGLFWSSIRLLGRGRLNPPGSERPLP